jgi:hypothetical protein
MTDLREAIESGELLRVVNGMDIAGIHPSLKLLCDAARRVLSARPPDYEAAAEVLRTWAAVQFEAVAAGNPPPPDEGYARVARFIVGEALGGSDRLILDPEET